MQQAVYRGKDENALIKTRSFCHMRYVLSITNNVIYRQNKYCTNLKPIEKYTNFKKIASKISNEQAKISVLQIIQTIPNYVIKILCV